MTAGVAAPSILRVRRHAGEGGREAGIRGGFGRGYSAGAADASSGGAFRLNM